MLKINFYNSIKNPFSLKPSSYFNIYNLVFDSFDGNIYGVNNDSSTIRITADTPNTLN